MFRRRPIRLIDDVRKLPDAEFLMKGRRVFRALVP
jgi:hypothetical protein